MPTSRVAIAILAAGHGARFGGGKLLAGLAGKPLIRHAVDAALASDRDVADEAVTRRRQAGERGRERR